MRVYSGIFLLFLLTYGPFTRAFAQYGKRINRVQPGFPFGTWMHSHEEDTIPNSEWKTYRKSGYDFPPARGRSGFIILADHRFAIIKPSANDGRDTLWGTWRPVQAGQFVALTIPGVPLTALSSKSLKKDATSKRWKRDVYLIKME